jgi:hypothetical protein
MSISQNFPEEGPTLNLNFAGSRTLDPRITFTRTQTTSNGSTYMGRDGLIKYAGPDEPRFDHRYVNGEIESLGLLIESVRENIVKESENFTIASGFWSEVGDGVTVTTDQAIAPDGTQTADHIGIKTSTNGGKGIQSNVLNPSIASQAYTVSIFLKAAEHSFVRVQFEGGGNTDGINVNLQNGSLISLQGTPDSYSIIPYPNNWYRIVVNNTATTTNASALRWFFVDSDGIANFEGTVGNGVYAWGGQFEAGAFPTSYIPTESSKKIRTADNASMVGENFSSWYNQSEGTVFINSYGINPSGTFYSIEQGNQSVSNSILLGTTPNNLTFRVRGPSNTTQALFELSNAGTFNIFKKYIGTYKLDSFNAAVNGVLSSDDTSGTPPSPQDNLKIGYNGSPNTNINGHIAQLTYYPTRLTNTQLQTLTK